MRLLKLTCFLAIGLGLGGCPDKDRNNSIEVMNKGIVAANQSSYETAINHFKEATRIYGENHQAWYNLGQVYEEESKADSALLFLNKTLELQPDDTKSMKVLGKVYGRLLNDPDRALHYLEKSRDLGDPDYVNLGISYAMKRRFGEAVAAFEKALEEDPNDTSIYQNLGVLYRDAGDPQRSQEMFRQAEAIGKR